MAQTLLTSPKNTTSSSRLTGSETTKIISSSSTLTTDSTTPPPGSTTPAQEKEGEFGRDNKSVDGELERDGQLTGEKLGRRDIIPLDGELEGDGHSTGEKLGRRDIKLFDGELERDGQLTGEKLGRRDIGELERDGQSTGEKLGRNGQSAEGDGKPACGVLERDSKLVEEDKSNGELIQFSLPTLESSSSLLSSDISLTAKISGPIGMSMEFAPLLGAEVVSKVNVKDRLSSMEPDRLKLTDSAIPSVSLENKITKNKKIDKTCSQSKFVH